MADLMQFPKTWEEFEENYGFTDSEEVYTNGARLIPSFRVEQWLEHIDRKHGKWQITDAYPHNVYCSECHAKFAQTHWAVWEDGSLPRRYCPNCGARMSR